jgi:hypothetical protein
MEKVEMKKVDVFDIIMAIPLGLLLISCIVGVVIMLFRLFAEATWTDVLVGFLTLWLTASVLYFIVIKGGS